MQRQQVIVSVAYCITFCGQSKQRFWLLISNEDGGKSTRQQAERKRDRERENSKREREQPWHHRLALGHLRDRRIDEPCHLVMLAKKGTTCSPVGTRYSALSSALFWSIWNTRKKSSSNLNFLAKIHGNLHCSRRQPRQTPGASGMRHAAAVESCISQQSHGVPFPLPPFLSHSSSLLATKLPQKRFLILIPQDSPWSIIIIRRASPADLCISRRSRRSSWVHANVNECIWILVRFSTSANTACKWMRIQVDYRIDEIFFKRFNWIG